MYDFLIVFSTCERYLLQSLNMYEQLRRYGLEHYAWVVPLERLQAKSLKLLHQSFQDHVAETLQMPGAIKRSGNKIFLPTMVPKAKRYLLLDTDIVILSHHFIKRFLDIPEKRIVLVEELFCWQDWLRFRHPSFQHMVNTQFPHLLRERYIQTGSIGISHQVYQQIFDTFISELLAERSEFCGDLIIWNHWVNTYPHLFHLVPPAYCLVLRPDGSGESSTLHRPNLRYADEILFYRNEPVKALHFTSSKGIVKTWNDYAQLMSLLS